MSQASQDRIAALEGSLSGLINFWREFGPMITLNNATNRYDYGMDERVEAAAKLIG